MKKSIDYMDGQMITGVPVKSGHNSGFTLIELLIVVAIIAILTAVSYSGYQSQVQKGRRSDAKTTLMDIANRQENFLLDRNIYSATLAGLGIASATTDNGFYTIALSVDPTDCGTAPCFLATATPAAGSPQLDDENCTSFSMDSNGATRATGTDAANCW